MHARVQHLLDLLTLMEALEGRDGSGGEDRQAGVRAASPAGAGADSFTIASMEHNRKGQTT